jgi:integrase
MQGQQRDGPIRVYLVKIGGRRGKRKPKFPFALKWQERGGKWKQTGVGTRNRGDAEKAREWQQKELNGWNPPTRQTVEFERFKTEYLAAMSAANLAKASIGSARWTLERFKRHVSPHTLQEVDVRTAGAYMTRRRQEDGVSVESVRKDYRTLHAAFNWAVQNEYLEANPFAKVKPPKGTRTEKTVLTGEHCQRLLKVCEGKGTLLHAFVSLAIETGMRIGEMANLQPADVDFGSRLIRIRPKSDWSPKARRGRVVAVSEATAGLLFELKERQPYILAGTDRYEWKQKMRKSLRKLAGKPTCRKSIRMISGGRRQRRWPWRGCRKTWRKRFWGTHRIRLRRNTT